MTTPATIITPINYGGAPSEATKRDAEAYTAIVASIHSPGEPPKAPDGDGKSANGARGADGKRR
ncbi:MAG: hypothetical protein AB7I34_26605 [Rhizobiaceae bacterium]